MEKALKEGKMVNLASGGISSLGRILRWWQDA
jgi:hypothetical protein